MSATDAGLYGIGEAYWRPGVKDVIAMVFKPPLVGRCRGHSYTWRPWSWPGGAELRRAV